MQIIHYIGVLTASFKHKKKHVTIDFVRKDFAPVWLAGPEDMNCWPPDKGSVKVEIGMPMNP